MAPAYRQNDDYEDEKRKVSRRKSRKKNYTIKVNEE
jgi:hypothetical protein